MEKTCTYCNGYGHLTLGHAGLVVKSICEFCHGAGSVEENWKLSPVEEAVDAAYERFEP